MTEIKVDETYLRQYIDIFDLDELIDLLEQRSFSLNFLRQFQDKINWKVVFERLYLHFTLQTDRGRYLITFSQFCQEYNEQFYREYFKGKGK